MTAKILGTNKDLFSVNALENYANKYIFHMPYLSPFGARKFFSVAKVLSCL